MGSNVSIASGYTRKPGFNRSNSRYSTTGVSRPHSPIVFGPQVGFRAGPNLSFEIVLNFFFFFAVIGRYIQDV